MQALLTQQLHGPTVVTAAATGRFLPGRDHQLVALASDTLIVFDWHSEDGFRHAHTVQLFEPADSVHAVPAASEAAPDSLLLLSQSLSKAVLVTLHASRGSLAVSELSSVVLTAPEQGVPCKRLDSVCCSRVHNTPSGLSLLAVSAYMDHVHIVTVSQAAAAAVMGTSGFSLSCQAFNLRACSMLYTPGLPWSQGRTLGLSQLEWQPCTDPLGTAQGSLYLTILVQTLGPGYTSMDAECLELLHSMPPTSSASSSSTSPAQPMQLRQGPWACRNLPPSATRIHALPGTPTLPAGLAIISSHAVLLIVAPLSWQGCLEPSGDMDWEQGAGHGAKQTPGAGAQQGLVKEQEVLTLTLAGLPSAVEVLPCDDGQLLLLGDSMAGLHLLYLGTSKGSYCVSLSVQGPVSAPSCLRFCPTASPSPASITEATAAPHNYLFLASRQLNSQLLVLPQPLPDSSTSSEQPTALLADPALVKSIAPLRCAMTIPDSQSADDPTLILGCGQAPWGRLCRAKLGVALAPYFPSATTLEESVEMFPVSTAPTPGTPATSTSHLVFSFGATNRTEVLSLEADTFRQVAWPGLDTSSRSLLVATLQPTGHLVQVLPTGVNLLDPTPSCQLLSTWRQPSAAVVGAAQLSLAASAGAVLVVATVDCVYSLTLDAAAAQLVAQSAVAVHQPSALHVDTHLTHGASISPHTAPPATQAVVFWGDWVASRVTMALASKLSEPLLTVDLSGHIARSVAVLPLPWGRRALVVGTNTGAVLAWDVSAPPTMEQQQQQQLAGTPWSVGPVSKVVVSNIAVELTLVEEGAAHEDSSNTGAAPYIYIHSGQDAVLRLSPTYQQLLTRHSTAAVQLRQLPLCQLLQVARVHGSTYLQSVCPLSTPSMPRSWAWVTATNHLMFGRLQPEVQLRWTTALIGDAPHHIAYHTSSRCHVLLSQGSQGQQTLHLVHEDTLQPLVSMRLSPNHRYTGVHVCHLPCTSSGPSAAQPHTPQTRTNSTTHRTKEFIVLGSYLTVGTAYVVQRTAAGSIQIADQPALGSDATSHRAVGLLSFFEVSITRSTVTPDGSSQHGGTRTVEYSLLLHGVAPVPSIPMAVAAVTPGAAAHVTTATDASHAAASSRGGATTAREPARSGAGAVAMDTEGVLGDVLTPPPHLVVACNDVVRVYQVTVDDSRCAGPEAAAALLAAAATPPLAHASMHPAEAVLYGRVGVGGGGVEAAVADEGEAVEDGLDEDVDMYERIMDMIGQQSHPVQGDWEEARLSAALAKMSELVKVNWSQHVILKEVAVGRTLAGFAAQHLSHSGSLVLASDLMASVSLFSLQWSPDASGGRIALEAVSADHTPVYAQASALLSGDLVLASAHPHGLLLLQRDHRAEAEAAAARLKQRREQVHAGPQADSDGQTEPPPAACATNAAPLDVIASCRARHKILHLLPGTLGLQLTATGSTNQPTAVASSTTQVVQSAGRLPVIGIAADGSVTAVTVVSVDRGAEAEAVNTGAGNVQELFQLQSEWEACQHQVQLGLAGSAPHRGGWQLSVMNGTTMAAVLGHGGGVADEPVRELPGNCLDGQWVLEGLLRGQEVGSVDKAVSALALI